MTLEPKFSVIIPTYNDWDRLKLCVEALEGQTLPKDEFEVLIVNNEPSGIKPSPFELPLNVQLLYQETPGSYAARNLAVEKARGSILAFTDSDCIPHKDWLLNARQHFADDSVDRLGGKISIFFSDKMNKTSAELYESIFAFNQERNVEKHGISVTANLFVRKQLFLKVGFFDSAKLSGGDYLWSQKANQLLLSIKYADDVLVMHPARRTITELARKARRVIGGANLPKGVLKKLKMFLYSVVYRSFKQAERVVLQRELLFHEKVKVIYVILNLCLVTSTEFIRLAFGGKPIRN